MSIKKLDCMELKDTSYSVYPYDGYNLEEILGKFYEGIKECNDLSFSLQEFNTWLISQGLEEEVLKLLYNKNKVDWDNVDIINQIKDKLKKINERFDDYATIEQLGNYATIEQLGNYATIEQLGNYATIGQLGNYATTTYVDNKYDMLFQSVSNGKGLLASAITDKGVPTLATDSFEVMANNIRKITTAGETTTPITISHINNMTVTSGEVFNITYTTNVDAVKHEMTFDGGTTYHVIHPTGDKNGYIYEHEAITETAYSHQRKIRVTDKNGNTATSNIFNITVNAASGGEPTTPITISHINDMSVTSGEVFNITYTTNVDAVKHEMSFDGGTTYHVIHPNGDKNGYIYEHEAITETAYSHQRIIRVTDSNDNTATSNTFNITVSSDNTGGTQPSPSYDITIAQSSYTIKPGVDIKVNYTSAKNLSTCMLMFGPDYSDNNYVGGYISAPGEFTFYTNSKSIGNYTVKVKGRVWNDSTSKYDDYYSNEFSIVIEDIVSGEPTTPITISHINDMSVSSGKVFNITYTTNVDAVKHEMSFDGGTTYHVIYPSGDKNGYIYEHEAITETSYPHQRKIRVTDKNGNTATSNIFNITVEPITISHINDMSVSSGKVFNITYTTNVDAVKHEMSFDGGTTYHVIYPSGDKNGYIYEHEAITETSYPHQRKIRVTDINDNIATSNTFNVNVTGMSPFLASMYGNPRVVPSYPSGIQFPPINAHEDKIQPNGVNSTDSWKYGTRINYSPREDWTRVGYWGQVYRQEGYGYDPDNVAVEIKNCKLWGWNGSSWVLIHDVSFNSTNTIFYLENFAGDSNRAFPSNLKLNGKNAIAKFDSVNSGYMWHPYSGKVRASDYGLPKPYYYCSTMSARLVKWDSNGVDNLDSAKLCFNVGGDYWHTTHETWQPDWSANGEIGQGQFIKCTREWRTAYCTNVPEGWSNGFPTIE